MDDQRPQASSRSACPREHGIGAVLANGFDGDLA